MKKKAVISSIFIISLCVLLASVLFIQQHNNKVSAAKVHPTKDHSPRLQPVMGRTLTEKLTIGAIGDILIHDTVYKDAFNGTEHSMGLNIISIQSLKMLKAAYNHRIFSLLIKKACWVESTLAFQVTLCSIVRMK
jgi:hypothetical protein